jgi:hypothetical protein
MENDSVLVSGFAIRTLSICYEQLHKDGFFGAVKQ